MLSAVRSALGAMSLVYAVWLFLSHLPLLNFVGPIFFFSLGAFLLVRRQNDSSVAERETLASYVARTPAAQDTLNRAIILEVITPIFYGSAVAWALVGGALLGPGMGLAVLLIAGGGVLAGAACLVAAGLMRTMVERAASSKETQS